MFGSYQKRFDFNLDIFHKRRVGKEISRKANEDIVISNIKNDGDGRHNLDTRWIGHQLEIG